MVRSLAVAVLAAAVFCPAVAVAEAPVSLPISLTAPLDGARLVPGQSVTISWERSGAWDQSETWPDGEYETRYYERDQDELELRNAESSDVEVPVEEWEAFLSINGGLTYPYRVTPHLDADVTSFRFSVPEVASADVRILVRMGNERREVGFEMPQRFTIAAPGPLAVLSRASRRDLDVSERRGEAARPGEAGVRTWVEGDRRGRGLRIRTTDDGLAVRGRSIDSGALRLLAFLGPQHEPVGSARDTGEVRRRAESPSTAVSALAPASRVASILLLIQRSNR